MCSHLPDSISCLCGICYSCRRASHTIGDFRRGGESGLWVLTLTIINLRFAQWVPKIDTGLTRAQFSILSSSRAENLG